MDSAVETTRAIRTAIKQGDDSTALKLIKADRSQLTAETPFGTWLHVAADFGRLRVVKELVEMGADIHAIGGMEDANPLFMAANGGHLDVLDYLLANGAKPDVSKPESNPLFAAIDQGYLEIAKRLIEIGIDVNAKYKGASGKTKSALSYAREYGRKDMTSLIESATK